MDKSHKFFINGVWVDPVAPKDFEVIHPGNEEVIATIAL